MIQSLYTGPDCLEKKDLLTHYFDVDDEEGSMEEIVEESAEPKGLANER